MIEIRAVSLATTQTHKDGLAGKVSLIPEIILQINEFIRRRCGKTGIVMMRCAGKQ